MLQRPKTLGIEVGSVTVRLLSDGDRICQSVLGGKAFEPESLKAWGDLCQSGGVALDIGAYTGLYSIAARLLGARAIAFEPLAGNRARFRENAVLNGVSDKINSEAASDRVGAAEISVNSTVGGLTSGASLLRFSGGGKGKELKLPVRSVTIDSLNLKKLTAIKIDVERAEPMVLVGAQETLQRLRPALLVEVLGEAEKRAVRAVVPNYRVERELDGRNWLMVANDG